MLKIKPSCTGLAARYTSFFIIKYTEGVFKCKGKIMENFTETVFLVLVAGFILRLIVTGILFKVFKGWLPMFVSRAGALGAAVLTVIHYNSNPEFEMLMIVIGFFTPEILGIFVPSKKKPEPKKELKKELKKEPKENFKFHRVHKIDGRKVKFYRSNKTSNRKEFKYVN